LFDIEQGWGVKGGESPPLSRSGGWQGISGNLDLSNNGRIVQLLNPTASQDAATKSYVDTSIPVGGIIMWSGANNTWPSNWRLCDGANGTPNLQGRFVLSSRPVAGSGLSARTIGQTGGAETVTLSLEQIPSHSHAVSATTVADGKHSHTASVSDPGHKHTLSSDVGPRNVGSGPWYGCAQSGWGAHQETDTRTTGISVSISEQSAHSHTVTVSETSRGSDTAHENMPPFYVLAFIMRVS
jgi:microcystin-dependent protein